MLRNRFELHVNGIKQSHPLSVGEGDMEYSCHFGFSQVGVFYELADHYNQEKQVTRVVPLVPMEPRKEWGFHGLTDGP